MLGLQSINHVEADDGEKPQAQQDDEQRANERHDIEYQIHDYLRRVCSVLAVYAEKRASHHYSIHLPSTFGGMLGT
jgi:hypothetical protein